MSRYRALFADLKTGLIYGELPASELEFSLVLNAPGSWSATLPLTGVDADVVNAATLEPSRALVWVERDGVLVFAGMLLTWEADLSGGTLKLAGEGLWSYFRRRYLHSTKTWDASAHAYITEICAALLNVAQADGAGLPYFEVPSGPGLPLIGSRGRERAYYGYEHKQIGEAVEQLAEVEDSFSFRLEPRWSGTSPVVAFRMFAQRGRESGVILAHGDNCEVTAVSADGTGVVTEVHETGAGEADEQLHRALNDGTRERTLPRLETVESWQDVTQASTLDEKARQASKRGAVPIIWPSISLHPGASPHVGDVWPGDIVDVRASHGFVRLTGRYQITEIAAKVAAAEEVALTVAPLEVF